MNRQKTSLYHLYLFADEIRNGEYKGRSAFKWSVFDKLVGDYQKDFNIIFLNMPKQNDTDTLVWIDSLEKEHA